MARRFGLSIGLCVAVWLALSVPQLASAQKLALSSSGAPKVATYEYSVIYDFSGPPNGAYAYGTLVQASNGYVYGGTSGGGANDSNCKLSNDGCGTIFSVSPSGTVSTIYSFCALQKCADGLGVADLIEASDGNLYGVADAGGASTGGCPFQLGCGTVFKITPEGSLTTLYTFCSQTDCADGEEPISLIQGSDGNLYGVTGYGGISSASCTIDSSTYGGCGTVFKITLAGEFTTLYKFCADTSCPNYPEPTAGLVEATPGLFYGVAGGGTSDSGIVFTLTSAGVFTSLVSFPAGTGNSDGALIKGSDGLFYGTTGYGGANGLGTVFKVSSGGQLTTVYSFCSDTNCTDGEVPDEGLFLGSDGNFYGSTAFAGGESCEDNGLCSTLFEISSTGSLDTIHTFPCPSVCGQGAVPYQPIQLSDGNFYGLTGGQGTDDGGVIYEISASPTPAPPVQLSLSESTITAGNSVTLDWSVLNAFSTTMQQCYAFVQGGATGAGAWTGLQTGTLANNIYGGSATITPTAAGTYTYALTCGGIESGFATLTVDASETADLTFTSVTHNLGSVQVGSSTSGVSNYGVKVTNTSGAAISATGISLTGSNEFKYQTNCPAKLASGAYCEVLFTFAPTSTGTVTANWSIAGLPEGTTFNPSNGGTLTGTGVPANGLNLTTSVHNFGDVTVGTSSPVYGTVLTNSYSFPVTLTYTTSGSTASFSLLTNCGSTLAAGQSCNTNFTFKPTAKGFVTASIGVTASYKGNPIAVTSLGATITGITLKGTGQ